MSDHRGIVIDFNTQQLLGQQEHIVSPNKRGLNANNPIQVERFLDELQHYWKKYNIATRISQATKQPPNVTSLRSTVNSIDRDITKAMLRAEKKVRKSERPPWSPALKQASLQVKYYKLLRQQRLQKMDLSAAIQHTRQQLETTPEYPQTSQEYQTLLWKAQKALKKIRRNAQSNRDQHLDILLKRYGMLEDDKMQKIIRQLIRGEATKRCYRKLKWIMKPPKPGVNIVQQDNPRTGHSQTQPTTFQSMCRNTFHSRQSKTTKLGIGLTFGRLDIERNH